jgi:hypothetical protein
VTLTEEGAQAALWQEALRKAFLMKSANACSRVGGKHHILILSTFLLPPPFRISVVKARKKKSKVRFHTLFCLE